MNAVFNDGDRVIAYGKYPGVVVGSRLNFDAYNVTTDPVLTKGYKRRRRLKIVVSASQLELAGGSRREPSQ